MLNAPQNLPDSDLALLAQAGHEQALQALIRRHLSLVYGICLRYLHNTDDAEDAVQEVFVKIWKNLKKIDPQKSFRAWIGKIATNTCLDMMKKRTALPFSALEDENGANTLEAALRDQSPTPADIAEHSLLRRVLDSAMEKLSPAYQSVLSLYYGHGFNLREISEKLNEPLHTIKSRRRRALIMLRAVIAKTE